MASRLPRSADPQYRGIARLHSALSCAPPQRTRDTHELSRHPTLHRWPMVRRRQRPDPGRAEPGHRQGDRPRGPCRHRRPGPRARRRAARLRAVARHAGAGAQRGHAPRRRADARARRRHRRADDDGAGQAAGRVEGRSHDVGRDHRMVCRRRPPCLWPRGAVAFARRAADGAAQPGRAGGGLHALELPDQPGGAQAVGGAGHRLLDDRQGARRNAGLAGGADPGLRRCRRAGRRGRPGVRQPGRDLGLPDRRTR